MKTKNNNQKNSDEYVIEIVGTQQVGNDLPDKIELTTTGKFFVAPTGNSFIQYKEYSNDNNSSYETTTIKVSENQIAITRKGANSSNLLLEKDKHHICHYFTPMGSIFIGVTTSKISTDITKEHFNISAEYVLDFDGEETSYNTFTVRTKEKTNERKKN